jgi:hypothetical protein
MDHIDRRGFLECMAWMGTGVLWTAAGGVLSSRMISPASAAESPAGRFSFVQISDTHVGFKGEANKDPVTTLQQLVDRINATPAPPAFVLHTGDQTHGQKAGAFDTVAELLKGLKTERIFYAPGEHDVFLDGGKEYLSRYGKGTVGGNGWQSFDYKGTHFVGVVNVLKYKAEGMGALGEAQLEWLQKDVASASSSTPVVVFAPRALVVRVSPMGVGDRGRRACPRLSQALRLRHGPERPHPLGPEEGGRQRDVPHRHVNGVSAARARQRTSAWPDEDPGGADALHDRHLRRHVRTGKTAAGGDGLSGEGR